MRAAYDLCLYLGIPHPDYLMGRDTMANFRRRGLTGIQWHGWLRYLKHFPLPHDRADFNAALIRGDIRGAAGVKQVKVAKLLPPYGRRRRRKTEAELKEIVMAWGAPPPPPQGD